jgi:hypothetical protein
MTREFVCVECGTRIWRAIPLADNEPRLCAMCIMVPGWHEDVEMRRIFDPTNLVDPAKILGDKP